MSHREVKRGVFFRMMLDNTKYRLYGERATSLPCAGQEEQTKRRVNFVIDQPGNNFSDGADRRRASLRALEHGEDGREHLTDIGTVGRGDIVSTCRFHP